VLYEKDSRIGGILRYGIPDFKLDKSILDRRMAQMEGEGVTFETDVNVGEDISIKYLQKTFDAVLLTGGARVPRDLPVEGRDLHGVYFAMEFLMQQNHRVAGDEIEEEEIIATDKNVVIIGGGDTGADCVGTSNRHGAKSVKQLEIMPRPPEERSETTPWPQWPYMLRTSSSHQEGCDRMWNVLTKHFENDGNGNVKRVQCVMVEWETDAETGRKSPVEVPCSNFSLEADLVLLAMGFTNEGNAKILNAFDVKTDERGQAVLDEKWMSSQPGVFVAGDLSKGASLVVRAIQDGRNAAEGISQYLAEKDAEA
jgi:glutamate synthase (NADPH/NADH) small chain